MRTLKQISDSLRKSIIAELQKVNSDIVDTQLGLESPLSLAHAAEIRSTELLIEELAKEATPITAQSGDVSSIGNLENYGEFKGIIRSLAERGVYEVEFTATSGGTIPADTILKADNNVSAVLLEDVKVEASSKAIGVIVTQEAGKENSIPLNMKLSITNGIFGIEQEAEIVGVETPPADIEDIEDYRKRVIKAYESISHGGRKSDFRLWASYVEGIKEVYPYSALSSAGNLQTVNLGLGFPIVYIEFPDNKENTDVYTRYIKIISDNAGLCGGQIILLPCKKLTLNFWLHGISGDSTGVLYTAEEELKRILSETRPYISGVDLVQNDKISKSAIYNSVYNAVSNYGDFTSLTIVNAEDLTSPVNALLQSEYTLASGEIPLFGEVEAR